MSTVTTKLTAAMRALQQEVNELEREIDRLQTIKATIRVNALRHGATEEQVERLLDGRDDFIDWMATTIKNQSS